MPLFQRPKVKTPWAPEYDRLGIPTEYPCPAETLYERLRSTAMTYPDLIAIDFMGKKIKFSRLLELVDRVADSMENYGVKKGDVVSICLPNIPQTVAAFYATNKLGCKACMIHPLSSPVEVEAMLKETKSRVLFSLDLTYPNLHPLIKNTNVSIVIISRIKDYLPVMLKTGMTVKDIRKRKIAFAEMGAIPFTELVKEGRADAIYERRIAPEDAAVILYSGGTSSGTPKGILLSSMNFNHLAANIKYFIKGVEPGQSMLTILPLFHGFGLGICVHSIMTAGMTCILVPQFSGKIFIDTIRKKKPTYIAGVPSMYESLVRRKEGRSIRFNKFLHEAFCGGDSVPTDLKVRFNDFMRNQKCDVRLREGYGLTETVTAATICPAEDVARPTVGFPFPGMYAKIVEPGTRKEVPYGTDGEICLAGPQVMLGYMNADEENKKTLQRHPDGMLWLHTGDAGYMDEHGYIFFKQRIKRIIKCSAFPVYPSLVEDAILSYEGVTKCAVVGIKDPVRGQKVKAFVVMDSPDRETDATKQAIVVHCEKLLNKWSVPKVVEFRRDLPLTKVGKINIAQLEKEEREKEERGEA